MVNPAEQPWSTIVEHVFDFRPKDRVQKYGHDLMCHVQWSLETLISSDVLKSNFNVSCQVRVDEGEETGRQGIRRRRRGIRSHIVPENALRWNHDTGTLGLSYRDANKCGPWCFKTMKYSDC